GKTAAIARRHADHYLAAGDALAEEVNVHGGLDRLKRLRIELENLVSVFERAVAAKPAGKESAADAIRAIAALDPVLGSSGPFGSVELEAAGAGAREHLERALALHREVGNRLFEGVTLANLGMLEQRAGKLDAAIRASEEALAIYREVGSRRFEGNSLTRLALIYRDRGRTDDSRRI